MWSFIKIFLILYKSDKRKISQEKTCHGATVIILAHFDLKLNSKTIEEIYIFVMAVILNGGLDCPVQHNFEKEQDLSFA